MEIERASYPNKWIQKQLQESNKTICNLQFKDWASILQDFAIYCCDKESQEKKDANKILRLFYLIKTWLSLI